MHKSRNTIIAIFALVALLAAAAGAVTEYDFKFHLYPNPYSPNDPGSRVAYFSYDLPSNGTVSIYIYDFESRLVRTVVENYSQVYGHHQDEVGWNGADDNNEYVEPGPYVIVLEVTLSGEIYRDTFVAVVNR